MKFFETLRWTVLMGFFSTATGLNKTKIIAGQDANPRRFPYFTSLSSGCGGSLITPDMVLTAAHCEFPSLFGASVVVNDTHRYDNNRWSHQSGVRRQIKHPDYYTVPKDDIMLLQLTRPAIGMPLVSLNFNSFRPYSSQWLTSIGLGRIQDFLGGAQAIRLQEVEIRQMSMSICAQFNPAVHDLDDTKFFCAGVAGKGSCKGDSGGPLLIRGYSASSDTQVGLVSAGNPFSCGAAPAAFVRVSYYETWIKRQVCRYSNYPPRGWCDGGGPPASPQGSTPTRFPTRFPTPFPRTTPTRFPTRFPTPSPVSTSSSVGTLVGDVSDFSNDSIGSPDFVRLQVYVTSSIVTFDVTYRGVNFNGALYAHGTYRDAIFFPSDIRRDYGGDGYYETRLGRASYQYYVEGFSTTRCRIRASRSLFPDLWSKQIWLYSSRSRDRLPNYRSGGIKLKKVTSNAKKEEGGN